jgi:excisionase family DNA binding protein
MIEPKTSPGAMPLPAIASLVPGVVNNPANNRKFMTAEDAAAFLGGLNARTVTRWAREGYLPAYPIGEGKRRLWRFLQADLEAWMLARRQGWTNAA